jgi:hypothetical protein
VRIQRVPRGHVAACRLELGMLSSTRMQQFLEHCRAQPPIEGLPQNQGSLR